MRVLEQDIRGRSSIEEVSDQDGIEQNDSLSACVGKKIRKTVSVWPHG